MPGNTFAQRRDAAILAVFRATGIRLAELAGIRYDPGDPGRSDVDLDRREIHVRGKGGKDRIVRIDHEAARRVDRYLRVRSRHAQAHRPQLWLGVNNRGPLTANGIYQMVARRGKQCGVEVWPHRFRHHFSHTWLDRGGAEGDLMELNGWSSPQMLQRYGGSARGARARRHYDLIMSGLTLAAAPGAGRAIALPVRGLQLPRARARIEDCRAGVVLRVVRVVQKGKIMTAPQSRSRQPKLLDAGCLQPEISSFRLHLAAEGKAARTVRTYTEAVQWFAAARLRREAGRAGWEEVRQAGRAGVDGLAAGPVQRRVRQQPVPRPAAVLQVARRRGGDPGPDGRAEAAARPGQARPGLRRRGPAAAGARLRRPVVPAAPRRRGDRRVRGDRDPPVGAGGHPV